MKSIIKFSDFHKVDIRVGTIIEAKENNNLRTPSIILKIDFGDSIGIKKSSAHLNANYSVSELINKQIVAVTNFQPKQIGNLISEVLVLGFPDDKHEAILVSPLSKVKNGGELY